MELCSANIVFASSGLTVTISVLQMIPLLRRAQRGDVAAMQRIRAAVKENRLTSRALSEADYLQAIDRDGRGWVMEVDGHVVGFAIANSVTGNIWALFVDPEHEGQGHGRCLHDAMVEWLRAQGKRELWLTTESGTRAQRFYVTAGWRFAGEADNGELRYELRIAQEG